MGADDDVLTTIVDRLRRLGTDTSQVEVKASVGKLPKSTGETLSAFANGSGGLLILGLDESRGFRPAEGFLASPIRDALAGLCSDGMEPPIRSDIDIARLEGAEVVVMDVPPLDPMFKPSHLKARGAYGGSFIRGGDGDRRLTAFEVTQLLSNRTQPSDDAQLVTEAGLEDLAPDLVQSFLARLRERPTRAFEGVSDERSLIRAGVAKRDATGATRPTLAGLLCLGAYPQQFFPQLFVSFVALPGLSLGDSLDDGTRFLDNVTCEGTIPQMLDQVLAAVRRNMRTAAVIRESGREDRHDYPIEVIRELVVNALLHRDYSPLSHGTQVQVELYPDRLVVKSPGGLYGSVIPSQLGVEEVSSTRNAVLAKLLADVPDSQGLPVSENRGSGLPRVMTRLRKAGMTPPTFDLTPAHVHVTVPQHALLDPPTVDWIASLGLPMLTDEQHIALALMRANGSVSNEMLRAWGSSAHDATIALRGLVELSLAQKSGGRRYATYELSEDAVRQPAPEAPQARPATSGSRARRIEAELTAALEAIRAGHTTVTAISAKLSIPYATANRRVNTLLTEGRIEATAPAHSRSRTFRIAERR